MDMRVFAEDWAATYGSPYSVATDEPTADVQLIEDGSEFACHSPSGDPPERIAFVDGVRRGEASLYQYDENTGEMARAVAGGHACGAVIVEDGRPVFGPTRQTRLVICGSGERLELPDVAADGHGTRSRSRRPRLMLRCKSSRQGCANRKVGWRKTSAKAGFWSSLTAH